MEYWFIFLLTFISLCAREGKRTKSDKPASRLFRRLYEFGHRNNKGTETE